MSVQSRVNFTLGVSVQLVFLEIVKDVTFLSLRNIGIISTDRCDSKLITDL